MSTLTPKVHVRKYGWLFRLLAENSEQSSKRCPARMQKSPNMKFHRFCGIDVDVEPLADAIVKHFKKELKKQNLKSVEDK